VKVITEPVLVDTGPIVALLRTTDHRHELCTSQARNLRRTMITCWPVLTEAAWLLGSIRPLLQMVAKGKLVCLDLDLAASSWMDRAAEQYADLRPQLADLAIAYLAEREGIQHIFTLDRRDFLVYRRTSGEPFILLPEAI
jgi:predicted nucleic acid-binding protein